MNTSYIVLIFIWIVILYEYYSKSRIETIRHINKKKNSVERIKMVELAKKFIGEDCIIYVMNGQIEGIVTAVTDSGILIQTADKSEQAVNIDYVVRIRKYPLNKKGKKKSVVLD